MNDDFPQTHMSNNGRQYTVQPDEDRDGVYVFVFEGNEVAELHAPGDDAPARTDDLAEWRLTFEAWPETSVLGPPEDPPFHDALFYIDMALEEDDEDSDE